MFEYNRLIFEYNPLTFKYYPPIFEHKGLSFIFQGLVNAIKHPIEGIYSVTFAKSGVINRNYMLLYVN